ncbi:MAG: hypothetical protein ABI583_09975 [Betaproteobacteria bacterium]
MHMNLFKKLLLIWMIAWLPVAGAAAAAMPLAAAASFAAAGSTPSANEKDAAMPCHGKAETGKARFGQSCSHCVLCHLAGALALPEMPIIASVAPSHLFETFRFADYPSFIPELTAPPPRPALA